MTAPAIPAEASVSANTPEKTTIRRRPEVILRLAYGLGRAGGADSIRWLSGVDALE
jgi:hypothetical protein